MGAYAGGYTASNRHAAVGEAREIDGGFYG